MLPEYTPDFAITITQLMDMLYHSAEKYPDDIEKIAMQFNIYLHRYKDIHNKELINVRD